MANTDVERLLALFESGDLLRPDASLPNTVDLARALAAVAGAPRFESERGAERIASLIGEPEHLVLVLADGLGMNLIERLPADAFLRKNLALELRAVFPSSTAPALTSLATGVWPAAHAVPAWFTYLPEVALTGIVLPFADRASGKDLAAAGAGHRQVFPASVQAQFFRRDFRAYQPRQIASSAYTRYITGGPGAEGYTGLEGGIDAVISRLRSAAGPTYTYLYFPEVDTKEHEGGVGTASVWEQVLRVDRTLARLKESLGQDSRVLLSADHGQITVPDGEKRLLADGDELQSLLRVWPPAGEPRTTSFHVRRGCRARFAEAFRERFGEEFVLITADDAESLELFGPGIMSPATRGRVGDFVAIPLGAQAFTYMGEPGVHAMKGMHGGLTPGEMRIPLVAA